MRRLAITVVAMLAVLSVRQDAAQDAAPSPEFCPAFLTVSAQAPHGFRAYRGIAEKEQDMGFSTTFHSTYSFPGAECTVEETEFDYKFDCSWRQRNVVNWEATLGEARHLAQSLASCRNARFIDYGVAQKDGDLSWRGRLDLPYREKLVVDVEASNRSSPRLRRRLSSIDLTMRYRLEK